MLIVSSSFCVLQDEPVYRPNITGGAAAKNDDTVFPQAWSDGGGEPCPGGTVPIRRTTERDLLRHSAATGSLRRFAMKPPRARNVVRRDSTDDGHEVDTAILFFLFFFFAAC